MSSANVNSLVAIAVGILIIGLSPWLTQNYLSSYNKIVKRWLGPLTISNPYRFWLPLGIGFILIGLVGFTGIQLQPNVSTLLYMLFVAGFSTGALGALAVGAHGIRHFGWNSWPGLLFGWMFILFAFLGAYKIFHLIQGGPQPMVGTAVAIGLAGGAILLASGWPANPTSKTRPRLSGSKT
jgi:hypothetical protein